VLQYVSFVAKQDTVNWFLQLAKTMDESLPLGVVKPFFESLAAALRLKGWEKQTAGFVLLFLSSVFSLLDWKQALEDCLLLVPCVKYPEFVRLFLEVSRVSREANDLKVDDELLGLDDDSTSEASEVEEEKEVQKPILALPKKSLSHQSRVFSPREPAWCPPFVAGQHKTIESLKPELISLVLSYLSIGDLLKAILVCKSWAAAVSKVPPFQFTHLSLYHVPSDLAAFQKRHKLVQNLTFMRQFDSDKIDSILRLFPGLRVLRLTSHNAPKYVQELASLEVLQVCSKKRFYPLFVCNSIIHSVKESFPRLF
jgi:hypothetical protein